PHCRARLRPSVSQVGDDYLVTYRVGSCVVNDCSPPGFGDRLAAAARSVEPLNRGRSLRSKTLHEETRWLALDPSHSMTSSSQPFIYVVTQHGSLAPRSC
ncbi:unnamed protein product, partial [Ectocarpus sp. 12 AP-2014]